jgi:hypothetical protein
VAGTKGAKVTNKINDLCTLTGYSGALIANGNFPAGPPHRRVELGYQLQRQTDRLIMRNESDVDGRHAFRQSKTGELVDIKEAPQLSARLNASRARIKALKLRLQLETVPLELVVNEDKGEPHDESTYRHWVSAARAVAVFGFLARDTVRQAIVRAERLTTELTRTVDSRGFPA